MTSLAASPVSEDTFAVLGSKHLHAALAAVHYEIVCIVIDGAAGDVSGPRFADVHVRPAVRFVSGYLSVEVEADALVVRSHGRGAAEITRHGDDTLISSVSGVAQMTDDGAVFDDDGVTFVPGRGTTLEMADEQVRVRGVGGPAVLFAVHGPAAQKRLERIAQLRVLARVIGLPVTAAAGGLG